LPRTQAGGNASAAALPRPSSRCLLQPAKAVTGPAACSGETGTEQTAPPSGLEGRIFGHLGGVPRSRTTGSAKRLPGRIFGHPESVPRSRTTGGAKRARGANFRPPRERAAEPDCRWCQAGSGGRISGHPESVPRSRTADAAKTGSRGEFSATQRACRGAGPPVVPSGLGGRIFGHPESVPRSRTAGDAKAGSRREFSDPPRRRRAAAAWSTTCAPAGAGFQRPYGPHCSRHVQIGVPDPLCKEINGAPLPRIFWRRAEPQPNTVPPAWANASERCGRVARSISYSRSYADPGSKVSQGNPNRFGSCEPTIYAPK
jgi:hypothetical protein